MDRIIPDDIIDGTFSVDMQIVFHHGKLKFIIDTDFHSVDDVFYDAYIEHHEDTSIMILLQNDKKEKYYFSPYITQKFIKFIMTEYTKNKPAVDHKYEVVSLINKIVQRNLGVEEVVDGESK